jgi:hypothetical protein
MKAIFTAQERIIRNRANRAKWRKANRDILNLKRRNRYATNADYRERKKAAIKAKRNRVQLREAA